MLTPILPLLSSSPLSSSRFPFLSPGTTGIQRRAAVGGRGAARGSVQEMGEEGYATAGGRRQRRKRRVAADRRGGAHGARDKRICITLDLLPLAPLVALLMVVMAGGIPSFVSSPLSPSPHVAAAGGSRCHDGGHHREGEESVAAGPRSCSSSPIGHCAPLPPRSTLSEERVEG